MANAWRAFSQPEKTTLWSQLACNWVRKQRAGNASDGAFAAQYREKELRSGSRRAL